MSLATSIPHPHQKVTAITQQFGLCRGCNQQFANKSLKSGATAKPVSLLQEIANKFICDESSAPDIDKDLATILNDSMTKTLHDEKIKKFN